MKGRSQCIINNKILMAKHCQDGEEWHCLPGGGAEKSVILISAQNKD